jgi:predicted Zn-dependent protease
MKKLFILALACFLATSAYSQEKSRGDYEFHFSRALGFYDQKKYEMATKSINLAIVSKRNDPAIYILQAKINLATNKKPTAISNLQKASRIGSEEADKMLIELGSQPYKALNKQDAEAFENEIEEYLKKIEAQNEPNQKRDKKTKTRK